MMTMATKRSIFKEHLAEWLAAKGDRKKRGEMIKEISHIASVHPKSVPRSFRRVQMTDSSAVERRGRRIVYGADVTAALKDIFEAASGLCAENLHSQIAEYVLIFKRDRMWNHEEEATVKLLQMSMGLMKLRISKFSRIRKMVRSKSTTKPGSIKSLVPVRSGPWDEAPAGTIQIDTVAHCNDSIAGDFVYTVNATDTATLWGARRAQWNKGKEATVRSMETINEDVSFPILEWHPDTGSEFVNWHCKGWVEGRGQRLTRSRPNRKNDNCFVEERNGHIVRKWIGYTRFEEPEVVDVLNASYDVLTPYLNHFVASKRIVLKERIGARWKITRERVSLTPYERVLAREDISSEVKAKLRAEHETLNPLVMKREIDRRLNRVFNIHTRHQRPKLRSDFR